MAEGGVPDIQSQKEFITKQLEAPLFKGDIWYIIDIKWLKQWKSYVGFESWDAYNAGEESANPGPIDNTPILQEGKNVLREHLIDDLDYTLIKDEGWNKLLAWYGMVEEQEPLERKVIEEGVYSKALKVEVYPWHLKICENSKPDEQISKQFSRSDTIEQLEKVMREEFNIPADRDVRLWNRYMTNMYEPLNKRENTLQDAGLYQGQVVVIETKNEDGTWPRQTATPKTILNSSTASASGSSFSTRSGNTYYSGGGYGSSGYEPGRGSVTPGLCGLSNIGNTCFMNSALQCMSNVAILTRYFMSSQWEGEINKDNPLGMHGEIAKSYAELMHIVWSGNYSFTVPRNFKYAVSRFAPQFGGYQQQDSQELMAFLLDGLHEDLNRIKKKPYIEMKDADNRPDTEVAKESWDKYKLRNDSIVVDIFHGLLKSTVECPECEMISVTFDPFCYLSLPLPVKKERQLEIFWVPLDANKKPVQFKLTVPKVGGVVDICEALQQLVNVPKEYMVVTDVYNHRFHKMFAMSESISQIMDRDDIFIYEVPITSHDDPDQIILPIYLREERNKSTYSQSYMGTYQLFGQPLLLPVPRKSCTYEQLYNLILQRLARFVKVPGDCERWWVKEESIVNDNADVDVDDLEESGSTTVNDDSTTLNGVDGVKSDGAPDTAVKEEVGMEISPGDSTTSDITPDDDSPTAPSGSRNFSEMNGQTDDSEGSGTDCDNNSATKGTTPTPRLFKFTIVNSYGTAEMDHKLKDDGKPLKLHSRMYISIDWNSIAKDKFYDDSAAESFDAHESVKNKTQKKTVIQLNDCLELFTTTEKLGENDPWYCPQCKKHQQATKKFDLWSLPDTLIIHLKRFSYNRYWRDKIDALVEFPSRELDLSKYVIDPDKNNCVYDLTGVVNHYGGLGGGHYTAYCKNHQDNNWYYYDDSSVSESSEDACVTKAAYVLVYQRKGTTEHLGRNFSQSATTSSTAEFTETSSNGFEVDSKPTEDMDTN